MARRLLLAWALAQCAAAWAVVFAPQIRFAAGAPIAALLAGSGLVLGGTALRRPKMHRIDISGTGELRVTVQQNVRMPGPVRQAPEGEVASSYDAPLLLLPGSVLWPGLIVLKLGGADLPARAAPFWLPVWRDSLDGEAWRALAVALAVIGRRSRAGGGSETNR